MIGLLTLKENFLFFIFFTLLIINSYLVIQTYNEVYSILFLVLSFICASLILFLFECEFIALIFIIIYVGAILIFFLFAIMLLYLKKKKNSKNYLKFLPFFFFYFLNLFLMLFENFFFGQCYYLFNNSITNSFFNCYSNCHISIDVLQEIELLGQLIYINFNIQFLIVGLLLFISIIGAMVLTQFFNRK